MHFVPFLESAEDRDRLLDARLADHDGLETPLQGGILLDLYPILVKRRRTDHAQLPSGEGGLEHVARVHGSLRRAGPDHRVQLVEEDDVPAARLRDLPQRRLEALLELAPELGPREHRSNVQLHELLVAKRFRDVAGNDALGEPLGDRGLAHTGVADEDGIVLSPPRQNLHEAANLRVAPDDRVELPRPGLRRQIDPVALQGAILPLGTLVGGAMRSAYLLDRTPHPLRAGPGGDKQGPAGGGLRAGEGEENVFGRHEGVAHLSRRGVGGVEHAPQLAAGGGRGPALARQVSRRVPEIGLQRAQVDTDGLQHGDGDAVPLGKERGEEVNILHRWITGATGRARGVGQRFASLQGESVGRDHPRSSLLRLRSFRLGGRAGRMILGRRLYGVQFPCRECVAFGTPRARRRAGVRQDVRRRGRTAPGPRSRAAAGGRGLPFRRGRAATSAAGQHPRLPLG